MTRHPAWLEIEQIIGHLPRAVDRVMGESGLYDKRTAAKAFRQAEGDSTAAAAVPRFTNTNPAGSIPTQLTAKNVRGRIPVSPMPRFSRKYGTAGMSRRVSR